MSVITGYARVSVAEVESLRDQEDWLEQLYRTRAKVVDIDKACDGLVWLLSKVQGPGTEGAEFSLQRSKAPLLQGIGGRTERRLEAPYGPAQLLEPQQVAELSGWLETLRDEQLRALYDPKAMARAGVYPQVWVQQGLQALDGYLLPHLGRLRTLFREAANEGEAVLVFNT
jgi:hypothetical protein